MLDGMDRRECRCMLLRLMARKATLTGRRAGRRRCDLRMEERDRRECAGTKLLRRRAGKADMKERVGCRECLPLLTGVAVAAVLSRAARRLRWARQPEGMQARGAAGAGGGGGRVAGRGRGRGVESEGKWPPYVEGDV